MCFRTACMLYYTPRSRCLFKKNVKNVKKGCEVVYIWGQSSNARVLHQPSRGVWVLGKMARATSRKALGLGREGL